MSELREKLAALEHEQWINWTAYFLKKAHVLSDEDDRRWRKQMRTEYKDLSEKEKDSDRVWADKVLKTITIHNWKEAFGSLITGDKKQ